MERPLGLNGYKMAEVFMAMTFLGSNAAKAAPVQLEEVEKIKGFVADIVSNAQVAIQATRMGHGNANDIVTSVDKTSESTNAPSMKG